jgi:hypothetical protein
MASSLASVTLAQFKHLLETTHQTRPDQRVNRQDYETSPSRQLREREWVRMGFSEIFQVGHGRGRQGSRVKIDLRSHDGKGTRSECHFSLLVAF